MNSENFHPVLKEPPVAHALHKWDEETRTLRYEYNGRNIISVHIEGNSDVGYRHGSDGNIQNIPFIQNLYIMQDIPIKAKGTICLSDEAVNMRPHRAGSEQAILGQVGNPLINGVNGIYDVKQDLLIEWNGRPWQWVKDKMSRNEKGELVAELEVELGSMPWMITLRMHYYQIHLGYSYHKPWDFRPNLKPVAGWCSWEACRRNVSYEDIETVAKFFAKHHLREYGLEYIQLDDGYERLPLPSDPNRTLVEGWLEPNERFPKGHGGVIAMVRENGFEPAIWTNANVTNKEFAFKNKANFIEDQDGNPMLGEWIDYLLDCSDETLTKHVYPYYKGLSDLGYTYFKTDAIRHLIMDGLHEAVRQGLMTNAEAEARFRRFMEYARKGVGAKNYFLSSWGVLSEAVGVVDACRIAMDANPTWAGIRMQLVESARWFHSQRILFVMDPDHICARTNIEWLRSVASLVSLSGGLYMLSDPISDYDEDRLSIIKKTLPTLTTIAGETGHLDMSYPAFTWTKLHGFAVNSKEKPVETEDVSMKDAMDMAGIYPTMSDFHPLATLWAFHLNTEVDDWCVAGRFATVPLKATELSLESLGLKPDTNYHVFDFWAQKYLGCVKDKLVCDCLELGRCQIFSFRPALERPQFIASSRHVSMDAISMKSQVWENDKLIVELTGVPGTTETYWFQAPVGYILTNVSGEGAALTTSQANNIIKIEIKFDIEDCSVQLMFK